MGLSRRRLLSTAATAAAGLTIVPRHVLGRGFQAPSDTLNVAGIGVGGKGATDIQAVGEHANLVAFADVDFARAAGTFNDHPDVPRYRDFREMLERHPEIDAVTVSTPDHTHAYICQWAMKAGKHVFCQKPLTRTLHEARVLAETARSTGVITQMGNQGHAEEGTRLIREWIEAGVLGKIEHVDIWTNRPIWPQAIVRPTESHHPPKTLSWDMWLGPAPDRPYHPAYVPFDWRGFWDFGTGALGDIACHAMDAAFWALDLRDPERITAETTRLYDETGPASSRIVYQFAARGGHDALELVWRDGGILPPRRPEYPADLPWPGGTSGQLIIGSEGILMADMYATTPRLWPEELHEATVAKPPGQKYPRTDGVYAEWVECSRSGEPCGSNFPDHAGPLTEMVLLGNLAVRTGLPVAWNAKTMKVLGNPAGEQFVREPYREGWQIEGLA